MRFERFVAQHFLPKDQNTFSGPLVNIATCSIALGVMVMVMAVCILRGFQHEITQKVVGFGSHIVVTNYELGNAYKADPISRYRPEVRNIELTPGVRKVHFFAEKGGMVKTDDQIHGILLKGVSENYDTTFFAQNLVEGHLPSLNDSAASNQVIVSQTLSRKLKVGVGDKLRTYFWQDDSYRARAFSICGIYRTDLTDFDEHYLIGDLRQVQKLNNWDSSMVDGIEVLTDNFDDLRVTAARITEVIPYDLALTTIVDEHPSLFSWLNLLNSNIALIITIMALVCIVAIISALLIMIFEKSSTIGILKTMGAPNRSIRKIFLIKSADIILRGIVIGDLIALALCWMQRQFHLIHLDSESYSMDFVPIDLNLWIFLLIGLGTVVACLAALLIPSTAIAKIDPARSVKID